MSRLWLLARRPSPVSRPPGRACLSCFSGPEESALGGSYGEAPGCKPDSWQAASVFAGWIPSSGNGYRTYEAPATVSGPLGSKQPGHSAPTCARCFSALTRARHAYSSKSHRCVPRLPWWYPRQRRQRERIAVCLNVLAIPADGESGLLKDKRAARADRASISETADFEDFARTSLRLVFFLDEKRSSGCAVGRSSNDIRALL